MAENTKETIENLIIAKMDHVKLKELKKRIGFDYSKQLQNFIQKKTGHKYATPHIRRSLSMGGLIPKFVVFAVELAEKLEEINQDQQKSQAKTIQSVEAFLK